MTDIGVGSGALLGATHTSPATIDEKRVMLWLTQDTFKLLGLLKSRASDTRNRDASFDQNPANAFPPFPL